MSGYYPFPKKWRRNSESSQDFLCKSNVKMKGNKDCCGDVAWTGGLFVSSMLRASTLQGDKASVRQASSNISEAISRTSHMLVI
jgi:hypothetical protein